MSHVMPHWEQQWRRVERRFERLSESYRERPQDRHADVYEDEAYAFFQACYHLKDWLKNDAASHAAALDVEQFITGSPTLSLCADLANASKHLKLTGARVAPDAEIRTRLTAHTSGDSPPTISADYIVEAGGKVHDAFNLARDCVAEWKTYLQTRGLL